MNVTLVSGHRKNWNAGASTVYLHLHKELLVLGQKCDLFHENDYAPPGIPASLNKYASPFLVTRRLWQKAAESDVIEVAGNLGWLLFQKLKHLPKAKRPLMVTRLHGLEFKDEQARIDEEIACHIRLPYKYKNITRHWLNWQEFRTLDLADLVICHSSRDADAVVTAKLKPEHAVQVMPLGSDPAYAVQRDFAPEGTKLLFWGSWVERKGIYALPRAFQLALRRQPELTLTLGGTGMSEEALLGYFAPEIRNKISVLPFVTRQEHLSILLKHDIFLFPSLSEGFGLALLEALMTAMPSITTLTGMGYDWLEHGRNCFIVPMNAPTALAQAVERLSIDLALRQSLGSQAQQTAIRLTWARLAEQSVTVYEQYLAELRAKP